MKLVYLSWQNFCTPQLLAALETAGHEAVIVDTSQEELLSRAIFFLMVYAAKDILLIMVAEGGFKEKFYRVLDNIWIRRIDDSTMQSVIRTIKEINSSDTSETQPAQRNIFVTLGLFSVVELTRPVTIMVPTLDYTIPRKDCCSDSDSPCEVFDKLKFPEEAENLFARSEETAMERYDALLRRSSFT